MADDLGYGHLGCYGQKIIKTPNIDRLAEQGVRFTEAYAGACSCAPARATLMTGLHAGHITVRGNGGGVSLQPEDVTVAQILQRAGYRTGLFGKWGLGESGTTGVPNKKGFDEFFGYLHQLHAQFYYPTFLWHNDEKVFFPENENLSYKTYSHDLILEKAKEFVRSNRNHPFFLYLPVTIPHHEFIAPPEAMAQYSGQFEENPIPHWRDGYALPKEPKATMAAMISHLDKGVGELLQLLNELGLDENTVVFFTSDNGPADFELENAAFFNASGGLRGSKFEFYEGGIRVPFIARWKGRIEQGAVCDVPTYFPDMMPTFLELAGLEKDIPENIDGLSILPSLLNRSGQKRHDIMYWEDADYDRLPPYGMKRESFQQAVRMGRWKAVRRPGQEEVELYDLDTDVAEKINVASQHPAIVEKMKRIMDEAHVDPPPQVDKTPEAAKRMYVPAAG